MRLIDADELETMVKRLIELTPAVDPVKHGRWIKQEHGDWMFSKEFRCSECGMYRLVTVPAGWEWNFCPYCGAKMDEVSE